MLRTATTCASTLITLRRLGVAIFGCQSAAQIAEASVAAFGLGVRSRKQGGGEAGSFCWWVNPITSTHQVSPRALRARSRGKHFLFGPPNKKCVLALPASLLIPKGLGTSYQQASSPRARPSWPCDATVDSANGLRVGSQAWERKKPRSFLGGFCFGAVSAQRGSLLAHSSKRSMWPNSASSAGMSAL
jgi:hypothetical protein